MNIIHGNHRSCFVLSTALAVVLFPVFLTSDARAQAEPVANAGPTVFYACYVPASGLVYRIKAAGLKDACLADDHVEFDWGDRTRPQALKVPAVTLAAPVYDPDGIAYTGTFGAGAIPIDGPGTRFMWYPNKAALRAGQVTGNEWDDPQIGPRSTALGFNTMASGVVATALGSKTMASGTFATALGRMTSASGFASTALGRETAAGPGANATAMGFQTTASGPSSTALGAETIASGDVSTAMGHQSTASGWGSTAIGQFTVASGVMSTAMGQSTTAQGDNATAMGNGTQALGWGSTAIGKETTAEGDHSISMGLWTTASGTNSAALGQGTTASASNAAALGFGSAASGDASTAMGWGTTASGLAATAMGRDTDASGEISTAMGDGTTASGEHSTAMGHLTTASGDHSTAMGGFTTASAEHSTAMGRDSRAEGVSSTAMGHFTTASGEKSTAMGDHTTASGANSTAMGAYASTNTMAGAFVYGDASDIGGSVVTAPASNSFTVRASGGFNLYTSSDLSTGCNLPAGSGTWACTSDVNAKDNFRDEDGEQLLGAIAALPIRSWNYKTEDPSIRHLGPTAQDFAAAFGLGNDEKLISTVDIDGVSLLAVQALEERTRELAAENSKLRARVANLELVLRRLEAVLAGRQDHE